MKIRLWNDKLLILTTKSLTKALMVGIGKFFPNFSIVEKSKSKELVLSMVQGVKKLILKKTIYENNKAKKHVGEPRMLKIKFHIRLRG